MDDLLYSLKYEMRQARHESCELTKTMWSMYSALEEVVDHSSPYQHGYKKPLFIKERVSKRHSLFHDKRTVPIWECGGVSAFSPVTPNFQSCSMPNSPLLASNRRVSTKPIHFSTPIIANMDSDLEQMTWASKEQFIPDELYVQHDKVGHLSQMLDKALSLKDSSGNSSGHYEKSSTSGQDSPASSGYSSGESSPTAYKEFNSENGQFSNEYEDPHQTFRQAVPNLGPQVDTMCHHTYENLSKLDTKGHRVDKCSYPNSRQVTSSNRCAALTPGESRRGHHEGNSTPQSIRPHKSRQFTPPALRTKGVKVLNSPIIQPAVVDMSPNIYSESVTDYRPKPNNFKNNYRITSIDDVQGTTDPFEDEKRMGTVSSKTVDELELDAEVAYIMSKLEMQERNRNREHLQDTDTEKCMRRPSLSSEAADSGRGSLNSSSPRQVSHNEDKESHFAFRPVEHVYETIPGEIITPVATRKLKSLSSKCPVDLDLLLESTVDSDHDGECSQAPSDNTYASLNISRMLDDALVASLPPPTPPVRRYSGGHHTGTVQAKTAVIRETKRSHHPHSLKHSDPSEDGTCTTKSAESERDLGQDGSAYTCHIYTVEDVLESVDRLAGHLPKSRDNIYYLVADKEARKRLSKCLREKVPHGRHPEEKSQHRRSNCYQDPPPKPQRWDPFRNVKSPLKLARNRHASAATRHVPHLGEEHSKDKPVSHKPSVRKGRRSLPVGSSAHNLGSRPVRTVWKPELLNENAIFC